MFARTVASSRARRRVALLMDAIEDDYQAGIVRGAGSVAQQENLELWCLAGGVVGDASRDRRSIKNFLFDLLEPSDFDGVLALSGSLGNELGVVRFGEWLKRYEAGPIVSVGVELAGCSNIVVDGA